MSESAGLKVEIKVGGLDLTKEDLVRGYNRARESLGAFFHERVPANIVDEIVLRNTWHLPFVKVKPTLCGEFTDEKGWRKMTIYHDNRPDDEIVETFGHELGHAFQAFRDERRVPGNHLGDEAFAEWSRVIIGSGGNPDAVSHALRSAVWPFDRSIPDDHIAIREGLLFGAYFDPGNHTYQLWHLKLRDAAILNFVFHNRGGLQIVLDMIAHLPPALTHQDMGFRLPYAPEWSVYWAGKDAKRSKLFDSKAGNRIIEYNNYLTRRLGLNLGQLTQESIRWYKTVPWT